MASAYAQALGTGLAIVAKRRKSPTEIEALNVIGDVEGREVIIVDDLTETAGTLTSAAQNAEGARRDATSSPAFRTRCSPTSRSSG